MAQILKVHVKENNVILILCYNGISKSEAY